MREVRESLFDFILVTISKSSLDLLISRLEAQFTGIFYVKSTYEVFYSLHKIFLGALIIKKLLCGDYFVQLFQESGWFVYINVAES